ncbi:hypothetical protein [Georgenia sp. SUBG003]
MLHASTRILVMSRGRVVAELDPATTNREQILAASDESVGPSQRVGA